MSAKGFVLFKMSGALCTTLVLASCGGSLGSDTIESPNEGGLITRAVRAKYTYQFSYNDCDTERQTFSSKKEMCQGLKSQSLNNYCAVSMREEYFAVQKCPGIFETEK